MEKRGFGKFFRFFLDKKASVWGLEISAKTIIIILAAILFLIGVYLVLVPRLEGGSDYLKSLFRFGRMIEVFN
ncbi:MAG: hypothetical protein ACOCUU_01450 [Nanoarchaeota archaeon]